MFFKTAKYAVIYSLVTLFSCGLAIAADGNMKIGIMNVQKVLVQSEAGMKAKAVFEQKNQELQASLQADQQALQELQQEIEKKSSVWSKEKKDEQVLEFNRMRRDLNTKTEDARIEMKRLQDKELEPIVKVLEKVVDDYGANENYTMILDSKSGVIYYDQTIDISDALIKELNKAMQ